RLYHSRALRCMVELELTAISPRGSVCGLDQLDAHRGVARLLPDPHAAADRVDELHLQRLEPLGVRGVHPVRRGRALLDLDLPAGTPAMDLDVVVLDLDGAVRAMDRVDDLAEARVPRQLSDRDSRRERHRAAEVILGVERR